MHSKQSVAVGLARHQSCAREHVLTHLSPETASPGNQGLLAAPGHSPPGPHRGGPPCRRWGLPSHCRTAGLSLQPQAAAPGARVRDAGAAGEGRISKGHEARRPCGSQPGPHLPSAAAAPRGPGSGTGDPHRPTWRLGARPPLPSHPCSQPASLGVEPEIALLSGRLLHSHHRPRHRSPPPRPLRRVRHQDWGF